MSFGKTKQRSSTHAAYLPVQTRVYAFSGGIPPEKGTGKMEFETISVTFCRIESTDPFAYLFAIMATHAAGLSSSPHDLAIASSVTQAGKPAGGGGIPHFTATLRKRKRFTEVWRLRAEIAFPPETRTQRRQARCFGAIRRVSAKQSV